MFLVVGDDHVGWFAAVGAAGVIAALPLLVHGATAGAGVVDGHRVAEGAALMSLLMMPMGASSARYRRTRTLRRRRRRAVVEHLLGFAGTWFVGSAAMLALVRATASFVDADVLFVLVVVCAMAWQFSNRYLAVASRCPALPVGPPSGWRADLACVEVGGRAALSCARACWLPMIAMVAAPGPVPMVAVMLGMLWEWAPGADPMPRSRRTRGAMGCAIALPLALLSSG